MVRILLRFPEEIVDQPIISKVILQHGIPLNIVAAHVDFHGGQVLADVPPAYVKKVIEAFKEKGVIVAIPKLIEVSREKCLHCGACYSLCPVGAITFEEDFSLDFNMEKCMGSTCGLCVDACPARAIKLAKGQELVTSDSENKKSI